MVCAAANKTLEQKRFYCARMTPSESLTVTDSAVHWNWITASVIFVDPGVQIDET